MKVVFKIVGGKEVLAYDNISEITVSELVETKNLLEYERKLPIEMNIEN